MAHPLDVYDEVEKEKGIGPRLAREARRVAAEKLMRAVGNTSNEFGVMHERDGGPGTVENLIVGRPGEPTGHYAGRQHMIGDKPAAHDESTRYYYGPTIEERLKRFFGGR